MTHFSIYGTHESAYINNFAVYVLILIHFFVLFLCILMYNITNGYLKFTEKKRRYFLRQNCLSQIYQIYILSKTFEGHYDAMICLTLNNIFSTFNMNAFHSSGYLQ